MVLLFASTQVMVSVSLKATMDRAMRFWLASSPLKVLLAVVVTVIAATPSARLRMNSSHTAKELLGPAQERAKAQPQGRPGRAWGHLLLLLK
ncbi:hypothetical protein [Pseudomonas inefficax]|uniref:hypothetical protein n=1 Tax=Pseudomonas inefficax TaxID=2078786 RepID=UPI0040469596